MKAVAILLVLAVAVVAVHAKQTGELDTTDRATEQWRGSGEKCKTNNECGGGLRCNLLTTKCERICAKAGTTCKADGDCCSATCRDNVCLCYAHGATCTWGDECCDGSCSSSKGCCRKSGTTCDTHGQCCSGICQLPAAKPASLMETEAEAEGEEAATPAKKAEDCVDDKTKPAAGAKPAAAPAPAAKKTDDKEKKTDAKKDEKKTEKKTAPKKPKKMEPASKECCSDFGQKCSDTEPCCPPNICSEVLGMCTLKVKID